MHRFSLAALACLFVSSLSFADVKEWTLLVYLNGNNNLDSYGAYNINEMEAVGSTDKVNVVVQWASEAAGTKRIFVKKDNDPNTVTSPTIEEMGASVDMGDVKTLVNFIQWGVQHYPAKHYFIDVWDHGAGWHLQNQLRLAGKGAKVHLTDISFDDKSGNHITTEQLGDAMAQAAKIIGHKVDIYGSDACLMAMAEVAGEMAGSVETFVGSEETEPLKGWPYDALLRDWNALPQMTGAAIGKILVKDYVSSYQGGTHGSEQVTFSAFDMSQFAGFESAIKSYGDQLRKLDKPARDKLVSSSSSAQRYAYNDYVDLIDFLDQSRSANVDPAGDTSRSLRDAVGSFVIGNAATESYAKSHGLAVWLPTDADTFSSYSARYTGLHFSAESGWGDTLQTLLSARAAQLQ